MSAIGFITMDDKTHDKRWLSGVCVPFIGSGTIAMVALILNRRFIGIELNPDYANMARRRISQLFPNESIDRKQGDMK